MDYHLETIIKTIDESKGSDIRVFNIGSQSAIADYFIICSGMNKMHTQGLAQKVEKNLKSHSIFMLREEGTREGEWILQDYGDIIIHFFQPEFREYYSLEKLWNDSDEIDISNLLIEA